MSIDGFNWFMTHHQAGRFSTPLQVLVAIRMADVGGLCESSNCSWCGNIVEVAKYCRSTPEQVAGALYEISRQTNAAFRFGGDGDNFEMFVPEIAEAMWRTRRSRPDDSPQALRSRFDGMRGQLVRDGILEEPCRACGKQSEHIDHIVPLSRGGTNDRENLQPLCAACNIAKRNKTMDEFMAWRAARDDEAGHA